MSSHVFRSMLETPFGLMQVAVDRNGALIETWLPGRARTAASQQPLPFAAEAGLRAAKAQLREYFNGMRRTFDLPLDPFGSPFEKQVWNRLLLIPYGVTTSYGAISAELGLKAGARAVGRANAANPIPIIIPCHRVIGSGGQLTGFGGGLPLKRALLEIEGAIAPPDLGLF